MEGAEREVLNGFEEYISDLEVLYIEIHHDKMGDYRSKNYNIEDALSKNFNQVIALGETTRATTVSHLKATNR